MNYGMNEFSDSWQCLKDFGMKGVERWPAVFPKIGRKLKRRSDSTTPFPLWRKSSRSTVDATTLRPFVATASLALHGPFLQPRLFARHIPGYTYTPAWNNGTSYPSIHAAAAHLFDRTSRHKSPGAKVAFASTLSCASMYTRIYERSEQREGSYLKVTTTCPNEKFPVESGPSSGGHSTGSDFCGSVVANLPPEPWKAESFALLMRELQRPLDWIG